MTCRAAPRARPRRRAARLAALALAAAGAVGAVGVAPAASAQEAPPAQRLAIRQVDATDPATVEVVFAYGGDRADLADLVVRQGGRVVQEASAPVPFDDERRLGVVLLIDVSGSMREGGAIDRAREAARRFVQAKAPTDEIAVVSFNHEVVVLQELTTDPSLALSAIEGLTAGGGTALYDGVARAAAMFHEDIQPNVLLLSDGADEDSLASLPQALGALSNSGAALFAVALDAPGAPGAPAGAIEQMVSATGGELVRAGEADRLEPLFAAIGQSLRRQYVVRFPSAVPSGPSDVMLTVGRHQARADFVVGATQQGAAALAPRPAAAPTGPEFLRSGVGLALGLLLAGLAVVLAVFSLGSTFLGGRTNLGAALRPYDHASGAEGAQGAEAGEGASREGLVRTLVLQRAVAATASLARRRGVMEAVESQLERANLPLRAPEALFFHLVGAVLAGAAGFALSGSPLGGLAVLAGAAVAPPALVRGAAARRRKAFQSLLPDTLQLLAGTLRAGYSLMQAVEAVSQEASEPMARELRRAVTEARLGRPVEEALDGVAQRMGSPDFTWAVMAIRIQREVGGNLSELLVTVGETMTERERLRRDVNALTAEGRVSATVLGVLPIGIGLFILASNPGYLEPLFENVMGQLALGVAGVMMALGFLWMRKIIDVEI